MRDREPDKLDYATPKRHESWFTVQWGGWALLIALILLTIAGWAISTSPHYP